MNRFVAAVLAFFCGAVPLYGAPAFERVSPDESNFKYEGRPGSIARQIVPTMLDNDGVYVRDINEDQRPDLFVTGDTRPALFVNQGGHFKRRSLPDLPKVTGAAFADFNDDGAVDLVLVPQKGTVTVLFNRGDSFEKVTADTPALELGMGVTVGDANGDDCPDIFVYQYKTKGLHRPKRSKLHRRGASINTITNDNGRRNYLLHGTCSDTTPFSPVEADHFKRQHWSTASSFVDINNDGHQDIHVANDFYRDSLYYGSDEGYRHEYLPGKTNRNGMSSTVTDINHDGHPDIFVSNISFPDSSTFFHLGRFQPDITQALQGHNLLTRNDEVIVDQARRYGLKQGGWGWSSAFFDYDNDRRLEFVQALYNLLSLPAPRRYFRFRRPTVRQTLRAVRNKTLTQETPFYDEIIPFVGVPRVRERVGNRFQAIPFSQTPFGRLNARGVVPFDYDGDGDLDLVFSQYNKPFSLYENRTTRSDSWVRIAVRDAWRGGEIILRTSAGTTQKRPVTSRTDLASQKPPRFHFGLGDKQPTTVTVRWNHGPERTFDVQAGRLYTAAPSSLSSHTLPKQSVN